MTNIKRIILRIIIAGVLLASLISFLTPELAIRRYVFLHFKPIQSLTIEIHNMNRNDHTYGHLFDVKGYEDPQTKDELGVFYLKKYGFMWNVSSVGTGP